MKKTLFIAPLLMASSLVFAQSNKEEVDLFQAVFGKEKKAVVAEFIKLEGAPKDAFWADYDKYETERKALGKKRIELLDKYATKYTSLDDVSTDEIIKELISLTSQNDKLIADYYQKIKKDAGVKPAAQFYQIEGYVLSKVRATIMENIPLIGELDDKK